MTSPGCLYSCNILTTQVKGIISLNGKGSGITIYIVGPTPTVRIVDGPPCKIESTSSAISSCTSGIDIGILPGSRCIRRRYIWWGRIPKFTCYIHSRSSTYNLCLYDIVRGTSCIGRNSARWDCIRCTIGWTISISNRESSPSIP